jgi:hypothetical protein
VLALAPPGQQPRQLGELSQQGTRHGELEFGLAALLSGSAIGLVGFGGAELDRAIAHRDHCRARDPDSFDSCTLEPPALAFTAVGLAWGFSLPLLVGAGLLFARGAKIHADAKRISARPITRLGLHFGIAPWGTARGGGAALLLRF